MHAAAPDAPRAGCRNSYRTVAFPLNSGEMPQVQQGTVLLIPTVLLYCMVAFPLISGEMPQPNKGIHPEAFI